MHSIRILSFILMYAGVYLVIFNAQELILGQTIAVDGTFNFSREFMSSYSHPWTGNKEIVDSSVQAR